MFHFSTEKVHKSSNLYLRGFADLVPFVQFKKS